MPNKHMRQIIKVEGGEGVVHLIQGARRGEERCHQQVIVVFVEKGGGGGIEECVSQ